MRHAFETQVVDSFKIEHPKDPFELIGDYLRKAVGLLDLALETVPDVAEREAVRPLIDELAVKIDSFRRNLTGLHDDRVV